MLGFHSSCDTNQQQATILSPATVTEARAACAGPSCGCSMGAAAEKGDEACMVIAPYMSSWRRRPFSRRHATSRAAAAGPLLVLLAVASAASLAEAWYEAVDVHLTADLCTRPPREMLDALRGTLGSTIPAMQVAGPPARWVKLRLLGCGAGDRATLALSDADADAAGRWHAFPGSAHLFPNATALPFAGDYRGLIAGGAAGLRAVPLGKAAALQAIRALSRYDPSCAAAGCVSRARAALVGLKVMVSEALRWRPIREVFAGGELWERVTFVTKKQARYVEHWGDLSYALWQWDETGRWEGPQAEAA
ncbi:hypothetical protein ACP4OV_007757 [Aristida adscensionis]